MRHLECMCYVRHLQQGGVDLGDSTPVWAGPEGTGGAVAAAEYAGDRARIVDIAGGVVAASSPAERRIGHNTKVESDRSGP